MRVLLDTNVLLRLAVPGHPMHPTARRAVEALADRGDRLVIVPQVLYEYWVVSTRPAEQNGLGLSVEHSATAIEQLALTFQLLRDERGIFTYWKSLVVNASVAGKNAHDARLVAAMMRHGVSHVLTFNKADFVRFASITVLTPGEL